MTMMFAAASHLARPDDHDASRGGDAAIGTVDAVRYAIRQVGNGWTVYDYRNLEPARVHGRLQIGLERDVAQAVAEALTSAAQRPLIPAAAALPKAA